MEDSHEGQHTCNNFAQVEEKEKKKLYFLNFLTEVTCFYLSCGLLKAIYIFSLIQTIQIPMMQLLLTLTEEFSLHRLTI